MKLVIFTMHYPYKNGEDYVVSEIDHLSKYFSDIRVVSAERNTQAELRKLPLNVCFETINRSYKFVKSIFLGMKNCFSHRTVQELRYMKKNNIKLSFSNIKKIIVFNIIAARYKIWIKKKYHKDEVNVVFYSYWLVEPAYALALVKSKYKIFAISRAHGYDAFISRGYQPFRSYIYEKMNYIYFVSKTAMNEFEERMRLCCNSNKKTLIHAPLGTQRYHDSRENAHDFTNQDFSIVTCSNVIQLKRLDILIDALKEIKDCLITWHHFGDGPLLSWCKKEISHSLNNSCVKVIFHGRVTNESVHRFYQENKVDVFINMSDYEGVPVSIMEAFSYGIPCIARDVGGNSEIVTNKYNGFLLKSDANHLDFLSAIEHMIDMSSDDIKQLRSNCVSTWKRDYCANENYNKFAIHILSNLNKS